MHIELKIFPCTASNKRKEIGSENTKERVLSITKSDSKTAMTSGKMVDYTESSEFEDDTSSSCQKIVDRDFTTDTQNVKDPLIGGNLPADAQSSSDYEEQDDISISSKREKLLFQRQVKSLTKCQWQWKVHQTLHCQQLSQIQTQKQNWLLFGKIKRRSEFMTLLIL